MGREDTTPAVIRTALRGEVLALIPEIVTIVMDEDEPAAARVRAFETIARYGLGVADMGQVTVEVAGDAHFGVIAMPGLEPRPELAEGVPEGMQRPGFEIVRQLPGVEAEQVSEEAEQVFRVMAPGEGDDVPPGDG